MSRSRSSDVVAFVRSVLDVTRDENVSFLAGSLAYYAFISIFPFGALLVFALAVVGVESVTERVFTLTGATMSPQVNAFVQRNVLDESLSGAVGAVLISFVTVLWGASRLFQGLDMAFSSIYGTTRESSVASVLLDALVLLVTVPLALVGVGAATVVLSFVTIEEVRFATPLFLVGGLTLVFLPLYYIFPDVKVSVREVFPGVVVAAVGWVVLQQLFQVYVDLMGVSAGSVVGAVILFLTWLYFASVVILLGGVVNAVHGNYHRRHTEQRRQNRPSERTATPARTDGEGVSENT